MILLCDRPSRVADIIPVVPERPRDRRDPTLQALRVALLEALHLERSELLKGPLPTAASVSPAPPP